MAKIVNARKWIIREDPKVDMEGRNLAGEVIFFLTKAGMCAII